MRNYSEVARIKQEIIMQNNAARFALCGPLIGVAKHQFITKRMEMMYQLKKDLAQYIGNDESTKFLVNTMNEET